MKVLADIIMVVLFIAWIAAIFALALAAFDIDDKLEWPVRRMYIVVAILLFAIPVGIIVSQDSHPSQTCLRGHEEWRRGYQGGRYKEWVCEAWQVEQ